MTRPYVLDVSAYNPNATYYSFWEHWKARGVRGAIIKLTESTYWRNAYGAGQIAAAQHEGMKVSGYHFSRFRGNASLAVAEANYAIANAHAMGLPQGSILVLDYEERLGYRSSNTQAAIAFLNTVKSAGFIPCFYSYSGMSNLWDFEEIHRQTGAKLWIAAYPVRGAVTAPLFQYFPSISDFTALWQFTDNFYGEGVDASVDLTGDFTSMTETKVTTAGHLDSCSFDNDTSFKVSGWFGSDKAQGKGYAYIILTDENGKELTRQQVNVTARPDVAKAYPDIPNATNSGFSAEFKYTGDMAGKKLNVIFRYTDDSAGNGNFVDYTNIIDFTKSQAYLDHINTVVFTNKLRVSGWFASDLSVGLAKRFLVLYDVDAKKELQRIKVDPVQRPDVKQTNSDIYNAMQSGFSGEFNYNASLVGRKLQIIARYSDDDNGEGHRVDYWFDPFNGPAMPVVDGKTETSVLVHSFSAESKGDKTQLTFK